jgi:eukaryotic-like serine/threonine-protein kinase
LKRRHKPLVSGAAAAAIVGVVALTAGLLWYQDEQNRRASDEALRRTETERAVSVALAKADQSVARAIRPRGVTKVEALAALADWREAGAALAEAEAALTTGAATDDLRDRVTALRQRTEAGQTQAQRVEKLLRDLDDARLATSVMVGGEFDVDGAGKRYAAAFAAYGLEVAPGRTAELAERIRAEEPGLRDALVAALDHWGYWWAQLEAVTKKTAVSAEDLWRIVNAADDDSWRRKYRAAVGALDRPALLALSTEARELSLPPSSVALLAFSLYNSGERDEALLLIRWGRRRYPADFWLHVALGHYLLLEKRESPLALEEAIGSDRAALALRPKASVAHLNLARALYVRKEWDEAITEYRQVIELDPENAMVRYYLGNALRTKKQLDEALAQYRKAVDLDPTNASFHFSLGFALRQKNKMDEAIAEFRKTIELDPKHRNARINLATALSANHQLDDAIVESRKAIDLGPRDAMLHYNLGIALRAKNLFDEAITAYGKAIDLQPEYAEAHCNLGFVLRLQGQFAASLDYLKRGHALGSNRKGWAYPSAQWVAEAEQIVRLEPKLPDVLAGKATPADNSERLGLAAVCRYQRRYVAAFRLYGDAFAADAKAADDLAAGHRHSAACSGALAAAGQGTDADTLDDKERSRLRRQALAWLRADLDLKAKQLEGGKGEDRRVTYGKVLRWQHDLDLAGVRDLEALKKMPADDQEACRTLWADVAEWLKKAGGSK